MSQWFIPSVLVFLGSGMGGIARWILSLQAQKLWTHSGFPLGILLVNVLACFLVGLFSGLVTKETFNASHKLLLVTGFCGGFSTLSTVALDSVQMATGGQIVGMFVNILLSLGLGMFAAFTGLWLVT
jgi:fluoride exporter